MILADCKQNLNEALVTPRSLNDWLINNDGYVGESLKYAVVKEFGITYHGSTDNLEYIVSLYEQGKAVILNVQYGKHWVLMTGYEG